MLAGAWKQSYESIRLGEKKQEATMNTPTCAHDTAEMLVVADGASQQACQHQRRVQVPLALH